MKPEDQTREAWDNAILPNTAIVRLAFEDGYRAAEKALAHRDAQPAVAVNQRMRTALQEIANTVNYAQWYQETAEKALEDANHTEVALDKVAAVAVNEQMYSALKMVMDDPQSLEGRPRTFECVTEAIGAYEAAKKGGV